MIKRAHAGFKWTMLASTMLATLSLANGRALAQIPAAEPQAAQAEGTRTFNIPSQPLSSALVQYGQQAGRQLSVDGEVVRGITSAGVRGTMTPDEALRVLLSGSNLGYSRGSAGVISITRPGQSGAVQLDPLQVQGAIVPSQAMIDNLPAPYAGGQVATGGQLGILGNRSVMDTPFNQTSYTAQKAQNQQAKTVQDVLIDDPSVRPMRMDGGPGADGVWIRGFIVQPPAMSYGGLYGVLPNLSIMAELAERVEVLRGPSALLNGMQPGGAIGGTVNVVPKRAPTDPLTQVTANYASAGQFGVHADVARRFGADGEFGVRFNGVYRNGRTEVLWNTDERALGILGLDFRGERVRLSADLGYQYQYIGGVIGYLGLAAGVPLPWAPSARQNVAGQPWANQERKDLFGTIRAEVDIVENVTAYAAFGAHDNRTSGLYTFGTFISNFDGTAAAFAPTNNSAFNSYLTAEAGLRAVATTGPIGHEIALTATTYGAQGGEAADSGTAAGFANNIYNPTVIARPNIAVPVANKTYTQGLSSLAIADTLSVVNKRIQLTAGVRLQQVTASNYDNTTGATTSSYNESAVSPSVALVFKPWENVSVYGNWIQGLQQGAVVGPTFTNAGEVFPPFKSTQFEAGVKVDWGRLTTTASVFQISQPSILTDVTSNTQFPGGEQVNKGLELNAFGEITEGFRVLGGVTFLSAVLSKTQGGLTDGWIAPFSPGAQVNLGAEVDLHFVPGLTLTGRAIYTSSQYIDTTSPRRSLPEWTRFDLGARYAFENPGAKGKLLVARLGVENVLDSNYWSGGAGNAILLSLGSPRTFRFALTADF